MPLLSSKVAASQLGITRATLYDWLSQSDAGRFEIRGQPVTIEYFQGGRKGQGRIRIDQREVERLMYLMKVAPRPKRRRRIVGSPKLRHIHVPVGRPTD